MQKGKNMTNSPLFQNDNVKIDTVPAERADETKYDHLRIASRTGFGGIAVPVVKFRGIEYIAFVKQFRPVLQQKTLELPRGGTDNLDSIETIRELVEETSLKVLEGSGSRKLGEIFPDTGLMTTRVVVWKIAVDPQSMKLASGYVEDESNAVPKWLSRGEVRSAIARGEIQCGMTIAAWALFNN